ncbi:hypothetical protein F4560_007266 [Saccharothrix ecbatanensis]|uniref:DUF397 domain-containing protein n=1 Tax=Saccharothrix ecbatanensis TaxID=1105145 RepID=A0A7W9HSA0_9PSEU|nr:DUF397 domain-containing protein [Saccharothrix ecbatanensis]MBB5807498.1 hypothetical protein [Saccharothrix ecbatanensis]
MSDTWAWRKSSRSAGSGECVEIARPGAPIVGLRDSKNPQAGHLRVSGPAFAAFLNVIKADRLDA